MKRTVALLAVTALLLALLTGCGPEAEPVQDDEPAAVSESPVSLEGLDAMPEDGAGESTAAAAAVAAIDAVPAAELASADREALKADRRLVAYLVRGELEGQAALFEVRADGIAHNIYGYGRAFDSGSIIWQPADEMEGESVAPRSEGEMDAVAAVDDAGRVSRWGLHARCRRLPVRIRRRGAQPGVDRGRRGRQHDPVDQQVTFSSVLGMEI